MVRILRVRRVRVSLDGRRDVRARPVGVWFAFDHKKSQGVTPCQGQVSLCTSLHLPSILSPTTPCRPEALSGVFHHRAYRRTHLLDVPNPRGPSVLGFAIA